MRAPGRNLSTGRQKDRRHLAPNVEVRRAEQIMDGNGRVFSLELLLRVVKFDVKLGRIDNIHVRSFIVSRGRVMARVPPAPLPVGHVEGGDARVVRDLL